MRFKTQEIYQLYYTKCLWASLVLVLLTFTPKTASSTLIEFADPGDSSFATAVRGINLTSYGFHHYDVFFVSGREETIDGWNAVSAAYASTLTADVYPNVPDSQTFSHLIKREMVRAFNANGVSFVSGIADPGGTTYEHHTSFGGQIILLPFQDGNSGTVEGTFASKALSTGIWGTDDLSWGISFRPAVMQAAAGITGVS